MCYHTKFRRSTSNHFEYVGVHFFFWGGGTLRLRLPGTAAWLTLETRFYATGAVTPNVIAPGQTV